MTAVDTANGTLRQFAAKLKTETGEPDREISSNESQELTFLALNAGNYLLEVDSPGFKKYSQKIYLKEGANSLKVTLEVEEIKAEVQVVGGDTANDLNQAFSGNLTTAQIESLPDNPQEITEELKRRYGDDILIQVNGFTGGQLPPKQQIESIRIIRSAFDAEFHDIGKTIVRIKTKSVAAKFFGFVNFNFYNSAFNARNALSLYRLPEQNSLFVGFIGFPLIKNKTSVILSMVNINNSRDNNILASVFEESATRSKTSFKTVVPTVGIDHTFNNRHSINTSYGIESFDFKNIGVGQLFLPERGYSNKIENQRVRFADSLIFSKKFVNEFRAEFLDSRIVLTPNVQAAAVNVNGVFHAGGATLNNDNRQQKLYLINNLLFDKGKQSLKLGAEIEFERRKSISADNTNGSYLFSSIADYRSGKPATFTQRQGISELSLNQRQIAFYIQDDFRLSRNLQVGLGLRYENQNNLSDRNNFSPRLSFIYSPSREGKIVFRSGIGIFYHWLDVQNLVTIVGNDGRQGSSLIIRNPGYPIALNKELSIRQLLPLSLYKKADDLTSPSIFITQNGFNYRITKKINLEAFHSFRRGTHQFRSRDINAPIRGGRPNISLGRVTQFESSGTVSENSLEVKLDGTLKNFMPFNLRYLVARNINNFDGVFDLPADNYNVGLEKGFSGLDQRHRFTASTNFKLLNKIKVTPIFRFDSPLPYTITTGLDNNGDTVFNDRPIGIPRNSARGTWFKQLDLRIGTSLPILKRKKLSAEQIEENSDDKPMTSGFLKNYALGVDITIKNVFNSANFQNFVGNQLSSFYRQPTTATSARQIQFGLNFFF